MLHHTFLFQSLGNHEFDNGVSGLTPFIENLTCPVLAANLVLNKVPDLAKESNLKKSIVLDISGHKIGIVGYLTPETKVLAVPNDVEYSDEIVALNEEVENLQSQGIKIIIALGHSGFRRDLEIAEGVEGLDLVIGGHTNTFLWNGTSPDTEKSEGSYPTYVTQASGRRVPVVQAYAYTKYLGKLHLVFDSTGELISADGVPIILDQKVPQDPEVLQILNRYKESVLNISEEVIGSTAIALDVRQCEYEECNIGNLITDAMVYKYASEYTGEHWTDAPMAFIQAGGIRTSIVREKMPTNITKGDLLAVMPFDGNAVAVTVNGSVLLRTIEQSVVSLNNLAEHGEFLQYSGIKVVYDLNKPLGSRIVTAEARCWACDIPKYSKILPKEIYKVLMPSFLASGGDGFDMFIGLPTQILDFNELSSTEYYVSHHSPIYPQIEGRITFVSGNERNNASPSIAKVSVLLVLIGFVTIFVA